MIGKALWQTITIIIIAYERARAFGWAGGNKKFCWQNEHCCLSRVRAKDSGRVWQARIKMPKFAPIRWFSGFSREIVRGQWLAN